MRSIKFALAYVCMLIIPAICVAEPFRAAVISDRDGFTYIRSAKSSESASVGKVRTAEVFYAIPSSESWWQVTDQDGHAGYMSRNCIQLVPPTANDGDHHAPPPTPADMSATDQPTDPAEQNALGTKFYYGTGVTVDQQKATYWFRKAADQGNISAKANLGRQYLFGTGVPKNREAGLKLLREGLDVGNPRAEALYGAYILSALSSTDDSEQKVQRIFAEAAALFAKATRQGGEDGARAAWIMKISQEAYQGAMRDLLISRFVSSMTGGSSEGGGRQCWQCGGSGNLNSGQGLTPCFQCGGTGRIR